MKLTSLPAVATPLSPLVSSRPQVIAEPLPRHRPPEGSSMSHRLGRREFLVEGSRVALGLFLLPLAARSGKEPKDSAAWGTLVADLEKQIPQLMEAAVVPGLS